MKDIEKIKSEDLGCQVADANPGNFAIEQEVAQLVGATVPQPTEPSDDDARELGAQLLVFLRRALTPIQTALRTAVADIYAHLDSRCTDYPCAAYDPFRLPAGPYDPMRPFVPRTLPNLLTAITAFSARKISNGSAPNDGIPDGVSLAHLCCGSDAASLVTKIVDDNYEWVANKYNVLQSVARIFTSLTDITLNCTSITTVMCGGFSNYREMVNRDMIFRFPYAKSIPDGNVIGDQYPDGNFRYTEVYLGALETTNQTTNTHGAFKVNKIFAPVYKSGTYRVGGSASYTNPITQYIYIGCKGAKTDIIRFWNYASQTNMTDVEIRDGACESLTLQNFDYLTAENMYNHILCRLKQDVAGCGDGVTITLGTTNLEKLEAVEEYNDKLTELEDTYGYTFA